MNNMDYLNQISADTRPAKAQTSLLDAFSIPKGFLKWIILAFVGVLVVILLGTVLTNSRDPERDLMDRINQRSSNLMQVINDYNPIIKSSRLRAISNNVSSVLIYTQSQTYTALVNYYGEGKSGTEFTPSETITNEEQQHLDEIMGELFTAKIEATLDRNFHRALTREVGYLLSLISEFGNRTNKADISAPLYEAHQNLSSLYAELQNFTDPNL